MRSCHEKMESEAVSQEVSHVEIRIRKLAKKAVNLTSITLSKSAREKALKEQAENPSLKTLCPKRGGYTNTRSLWGGWALEKVPKTMRGRENRQ